jgi:hypothetical protein
MVQLAQAWDASSPQPVFNPLVLELLRRAAADPSLAITMSKAQGGLGLTALLSPAKGPWRSWVRGLCWGGCAGVAAVLRWQLCWQLCW